MKCWPESLNFSMEVREPREAQSRGASNTVRSAPKNDPRGIAFSVQNTSPGVPALGPRRVEVASQKWYPLVWASKEKEGRTCLAHVQTQGLGPTLWSTILILCCPESGSPASELSRSPQGHPCLWEDSSFSGPGLFVLSGRLPLGFSSQWWAPEKSGGVG